MAEGDLRSKVINATKWSSITELAAKIVIPITTMILARILSPEIFGVIATITMIISFVEMFTDAGFQKYLIQHEFNNDEEKFKHANVAFWTNLAISFMLWGIISIFAEQIATLVGNPGLGIVIIIACVQLPLTSFSSIQMALYKRAFNFKTLFWVRLISVFIPFIITIPLAMLGFSYWSLIIGTICGHLLNAVVLTIKSNWKPKKYYSFGILKKMLSFSIWTIFESFSIWLTLWVDAFIVGTIFNEYFLGLYRTSTTMVNALLALITGATTPILFSTLSRMQNDNERFQRTFFKIQRLISIIIFPMGVLVFLYSDLVSNLLFGKQWSESSDIIGIWALSSTLTIVFGHYCSEVYRAKGKPKLSFFAQILHLVVLVPVCIVSAKYGFWIFIYIRSLIRLQSVIVHFIIMKIYIKFSISKILKNVFPMVISATLMGIFGNILYEISAGVIWSIISMILCIIFYVISLFIFPSIRKEIFSIVNKLATKFI